MTASKPFPGGGALVSLRAFLRGVASVLDMGGVLGPRLEDVRRPGETGAQADARALASDWRAVGDDLRAATLAEQRDAVTDVVRQIQERAEQIPHTSDSAEVLRLTTEMRVLSERLRRLSDTINAARRELRRP